MSSKRWLAISLGGTIALAAIGGGYLAMHGERHAENATLAAERPDGQSAAFSFDWQRGAKYIYDVRLDVSARLTLQQVTAAEGDLSSIALSGELELKSYGKTDDGYLFAIALAHVKDHSMRIMGQDALPDSAVAATFDGHEGYLRLDANGAVKGLWFKKNAPPMFKVLMQQIVAATTVTLPSAPAHEWTASEASIFGRATAQYAAVGDLAIGRTRSQYESLEAFPMGLLSGAAQSVKGGAKIELDRVGIIDAIADDETVHVAAKSAPGKTSAATLDAHVVVRLKRKAIEAWAAPTDVELDLATLDSMKPGEHLQAVDSSAKVREQLASQITIENVEGTALAYDGGNSLPRGFMQRAAALLEVRPEFADDLVAIFEQTTRASSRGLILDVLAAAGGPRAQAAMRKAITSPVARSEARELTMLVQRFGLLTNPDPESVALVATFLDEAKVGNKAYDKGGDVRRGALYALGTAAGTATRTKDGAWA